MRSLKSVVPVEPARGGPFAAIERLPDMVRNMGGQDDTNQRLTRRMLFLLEGEPLSDAAGLPRRAARPARTLHRAARRRRHAAAVPAERPHPLLPHHRGRLRVQDRRGRQALGPAQPEARLLPQAALRQRALRARRHAGRASRRQGRHGSRRCSACTPLDRMAEICGAAAVGPIFDAYDHFLAQLAKPGVRRHLERLTRRERDDPVFRDLKDAGYGFTRDLAAPVRDHLRPRPPDPPGDPVLKWPFRSKRSRIEVRTSSDQSGRRAAVDPCQAYHSKLRVLRTGRSRLRRTGGCAPIAIPCGPTTTSASC